MKIFKTSVWALSATFFGILFAVSLVGGSVTNTYKGQINSFLNVDSYEIVDDSSNEVPNATYYESPYIKTRWYLNPTTGKYEYQIKKNYDAMKEYCIRTTKNVDTEGTVLLSNKSNALPLAEGSKISLFGTYTNESNYLASGHGSGAHATNAPDDFETAFSNCGITINPKLKTKYNELKTTYRPVDTGSTIAGDINNTTYVVNEAPFSKVKSVADSTIDEYGDAAIFIVSRLGGECGDTNFNASGHVDNNYQDLTSDEQDVLTNLVAYKTAGKLKKIIVLLNTCNSMQFKTLSKFDIDSCLYVGNGGSGSFAAIAEVISGKSDPSGHLTDTYLYDSYSNPATVNFGNFEWKSSGAVPANQTYTRNNDYVVYQEGIYVGYKYYETRYEDIVLSKGNANGSFGTKNSTGTWAYNEEVAYPFGFGGSYAEFKRSNYKVVEKDKTFVCSIDIENISSTYSGQDTFQVYSQEEYTDYDKTNNIEKPSVHLVGVGKTNLLKPGEKTTLNLTIKKSDLASYDAYNKKTYIMEKGKNYIATGLDSHDALNNILALKGKTISDGMDRDGNATFAYSYDVTSDDYETYSKSEKTDYPITNQFDNADLNSCEYTKDQKITYLSRSDWAGTYPVKAPDLICTDTEMVSEMQYGGKTIVYDSDKESLPKYSVNHGLSLIDMLYLKSDDPKWETLIEQMSYEEQCKMTTWGSAALAGSTSVSALGIKSGDGPVGLRALANSVCYPAGPVVGSTFNLELVKRLGSAMGMEYMDAGNVGIYGPGSNIHRSNFSGRNWEYFSEDGYLSGMLLGNEISGLQSRGVIPFAKHFVLNDQERNRYGVSVWANEQSIREVYLKAFEAAVEDYDLIGLMSSFNRIGCTWSGNHKGLLTEVLRNEWGFAGVCETDAGVGNHMLDQKAFVKGVQSGQDVWMSGMDTNVYGDYKNELNVAWSISAAAKHNLYAQLHSFTMNGIKSGSKIVEITPYWVNLLTGIQVASGVITGCLLAMTAVSAVLFFLKRKEA